MTFWAILVLGVLKDGLVRRHRGLGCDYDRLQELANEHMTLRQMLQHPLADDYRYSHRTIKNNVDLLSPAVLKKINEIVVGEGLDVAGKSPGDALDARADSFVVETNVHHPTDVNLLWDAMRVMVRDGARLAKTHGLSGWRQADYLLRNGMARFNKVSHQQLGANDRTTSGRSCGGAQSSRSE